MNEPKVSVIVPVYNTDRFLVTCLSNIAAQSYRNIEIIIVNDGSTDKSHDVISEFIAHEKRAVYISQMNKGVSAARNAGLAKATGEYILFCDSDDYNPNNAISALVRVALRDGADIVVGNYLKKSRFSHKLIKVIKTSSAKDLIESFIVGNNHAGLWNKLYSRESLSGVLFNEEVSVREDMVFNVHVLLGNPKVSFTSDPVYVYVQRKGSAIKEVSRNKMNESGLVTALLAGMLKEKVSDAALNKMLALDAYGNIVNYRQWMSNEQLASNLKALDMRDFGLKKRILIILSSNRLVDLSCAYRAIKALKQSITMY